MAGKSTVTAEFPTVSIGGKTYELKPTLNAVRRISQAAGGILAAYKRSSDMDIDVTATVIAAGANLTFKNQEESDKFAKAVWQTDLQEYQSGLSEYFVLLFQGGKKAEPDDEKPKEEAKEGNA